MIIFASRTGNVRAIVQKLALPHQEIQLGLPVEKPFILFTYTDGLGSIPQVVAQFLEQNHQHCIGVIASGNSNFGHDVFCGSANKIHQKYSIPIICKMELRGFPKDYEIIKEFYYNHFKSEVTS